MVAHHGEDPSAQRGLAETVQDLCSVSSEERFELSRSSVSGGSEEDLVGEGFERAESDRAIDGTELTEKQIAARIRLHRETAHIIEEERIRAFCQEKADAASQVREAARDDVPEVVYFPEDAPDGPPWRYDLTPTQRAIRDGKKAQRAHKRRNIKEKALDKTPNRLRNPSDLQVRFRTALVYTLVTIACIMAGSIPTLLYLMAVAGICAGEFFYMLRSDSKLPNEALGIGGAVLYLPAVYFFGLAGALIVAIVQLVALLVWFVFWLKSHILDVGISFFGAAYTGLMLSGLLIIRQSMDDVWGGVVLFLIFLSVWTNDAFAYFIGKRFGKHKLAPRTSPKKSWEGFLAGLVGSVLCWVVIVFVPGISLSIPQAIAFGLLCGLMEVLGDLAESRIKRNSGFKDSGTIMPGHGGLLDRCDSLFLASVTACMLLLVGGCIPYTIW